ncbi:MAG TPA: aminopeptidase [Virgibacillus sp.]|nr:aminopeptidase [Virgibacillus sp.]
MINIENYIETAKSVFQQNLHISDDEHILIVTDPELLEIADIFYHAGVDIGNETVLMKMKTRTKSGEEPPKSIAEAMKHADVALCITKHSLTHTQAKKQASAVGTRVATMPGVTFDMLNEGAISADYSDVEKLTAVYCDILQKGTQCTITKGDTALTFSIDGRDSISSTGVFSNPGDSGNLPSGEGYIAPLENSANGSILVDGSIAGLGVIDEPIVLTLEHGRLVDATGEMGKQLLDVLGDGEGRTIAEFGIGTNKKARLTGNVLEDEKVYGTVHIAFGSNKPFGGVTDAGVHIDCVIKDPVVHIDGKQIFFD